MTIQNTPQGSRRTARDRMREERARDRAADKRKRTLKVAGVMVVVLAAATGIGVAVAGQQGGTEGAAAESRPVLTGPKQAPATLTVYEDFRCPACAQFENTYRETVHDLQDAGKLKAEYHLVTIIDDNMGGKGSMRAANAALCARDQGKFRDYHDVLFQNQPPEQKDVFADTAHLLKLAGKVEGLGDAEFRSCVKEGAHEKDVERSNDAFLKGGYSSTPTVLLDGEDVYAGATEPLTPQRLEQLVEDKA